MMMCTSIGWKSVQIVLLKNQKGGFKNELKSFD
jgi:hypothetical protein